MGTSAVVLGASGYSGGEVLRLLSGHPSIQVLAAAGSTRAGNPVSGAHPHLESAHLGSFVTADEALSRGPDVVFSCLPHGALAERGSPDAPLVVDLSGDHRADRDWIYGLTEFARSDVASSTRIANPGCYPTATLLALVPLAREGLIEGPIVVDAISGISGAGRTPSDDLLFSNAVGSLKAYGPTEHRHVPEMERMLADVGGIDARVSFTPHLAPVARGLVVTARAHLTRSVGDDDLLDALTAAYSSEPFVSVIADWPESKAVVGTNKALVSARVDRRTGFVIASCAIDNLGKGAAGQAIQNANIALGLDETAGLEGLAVWP